MTDRSLTIAIFASALPSLFLAETPSVAAESEARAMTITEAVQYAREHQPQLRASLARYDALRAAADVPRARWYPTLVGTAQIVGSTTNNTTGSYLAVPGFDNPRVSATRAESTSSASLGPAATTLVGLGVRQEVFDFGRISAEAAAEDLRAEVAHAAVDASRIAVDYDVEEAFFAVYAARSVLEASDKAYARTVVHRDLARAGVDSGLRRPIELTRAEATLDRYDLGRIRARRGIVVAQSVLAAAVGLPTERVDAAGPPPDLREPPPLQAELAAAASNNPDLREAQAQLRAQQGRTHAIETETRPNLFATGAISGNAGGATPSSGESAPGAGLLPAIPNWDVGLVLAWPIFDATVTARRDESRREDDAVREEANVAWTRVAAAVELAYEDASAAREALPALQHSRDAAVANYEQANARFEVGMSNAVELADAEDLRADAEIQLAIGTFEVARARAALARLAGEKL